MSIEKSSPDSTQYRSGDANLDIGMVAEAICPCSWSCAFAVRAFRNGVPR
ncbi:MAG: hypothetical protein ACI399_06645 [Candidatus Cryptobacteroides sp.]